MNDMGFSAMIRGRGTSTGSRLATVVFALYALCAHVSAADVPVWVATWAASDMAAGTSSQVQKVAALENFTLRQVVRSTIGGDAVRVRISNVFGDEPLILAGASIAVRSEAATIVPATLRPLTFAGSTSASIPAGEFLYSDTAVLQTGNFAELAVSLYFPQALPALTRHGSASENTYISAPGNFSSAETFSVVQEIGNAVFLTGVEVATADDKALIVAFGDSITEGAGAEQHMDWPSLLAQRMAGAAGVINQGITGSRLLHDFVGESALKRFERDALSWSNVDFVIVAIGINDLRYSTIDPSVLPPGVDAGEIGADEMIAAYRELIAMAHARGVAIVGSTLTPYEVSGAFSEQGEATRIAINQWMRTSKEFDAVIDFDKTVRDAQQPARLAPQFVDNEDWLHPSPAGYKAMADSVDLSIFELTPL